MNHPHFSAHARHQLLIDLLHGVERPVFVELGAHHGQDTRIFLSHLKEPRYYAVEADPRAIAIFKEKVPFPVYLSEVAVAAQDGPVTFYQSDGEHSGHVFDASSSIRKPTGHLEVFGFCKFPNQITVPGRSLDSLAREWGIDHINMIWADVQGAEVDVIAGGQKILSRTQYMFTEFSDRPLYEGQIPLDQILKRLPGDWHLVAICECDALLVNRAF